MTIKTWKTQRFSEFMWFWFNLCFYFSLAKNRYLTGKCWCLCTSTLSLPLEHMDFTRYPSVSVITSYIAISIPQWSPLSVNVNVFQYLYVILPVLLIVKCQCFALKKYLHYRRDVLICKVYVKTKWILPNQEMEQTFQSYLISSFWKPATLPD